MVKIAIAGGSGELAREIIDVLLATKKHDLTILSRTEPTAEKANPGLTWKIVDYDSQQILVKALKGIHTVLSFVNQPTADEKDNSQKRIIDACIAAGVKRFAPSEYGCNEKHREDILFWGGKIAVASYLEEVNKPVKVLEYTLFQPGFFLDYLATPHKTTKYITPLDLFIDFQNRRAIVVEGYEDAIVTFTAVKDIANVVAQAVDIEEGKWPAIGGVCGNRVTVNEIIGIGEKIRGGKFTIDKVTLSDLQAGVLKTSWTLGKKHPAFTEEQAKKLMTTVMIGILISSVKGAWDVGDAWNTMLPDYKFVGVEEFLGGVWRGME